MGTTTEPKVHPVIASIARELLNKSENERSGVLSTAMSFLGLYRDPVVARNTSSCDWRIADLMEAKKPLSLYLVIPSSGGQCTFSTKLDDGFLCASFMWYEYLL